MKYQAPRGTRDFYPPDMAIRNWITDAWRRVSLRHGFEEYDGPIFESLDLYKAKSGEGIVSELFSFQDRGGREFALRPEMTPTLARMVAAQAQSLSRPVKWFSVPRLCRAERPQRGRLREFFQWNIDVVGINDVVTDAECIFVAVDFFREVGLRPEHLVMKVNSRSLLASLLVARGVSNERHEAIFAVLDKRDKLPADAFAAEVEKVTQGPGERDIVLGIGQAHGAEGLVSLRELAAGNAAAEAELGRLGEVLDLLGRMGVGEYCEFDMSVVRGLAYYTGVVFEGFSKGELRRAICGGGRYDELLGMVGGPPMSGIGFGTSDVVVLDVLNEFGLLPPEASASRRPGFFVIDAEESLFGAVLEVVGRLRQGGHSAEFSYRRQAVGKQLKQANTRGAARAVIVGQEYVQRGVVSVKDLATGEQVEIACADFLAKPCG